MTDYCDKCNRTGLLPFVKDGKVISNVFLDCECKDFEHEQHQGYSHPRPEDFDFPMSPDYRAWTYQHCGIADPGFIPVEREPEKPEPQEIIHRHSNMGKAEFALLQQLEGEVKYLRRKVGEGESPARKSPRFKTYEA